MPNEARGLNQEGLKISFKSARRLICQEMEYHPRLEGQLKPQTLCSLFHIVVNICYAAESCCCIQYLTLTKKILPSIVENEYLCISS